LRRRDGDAADDLEGISVGDTVDLTCVEAYAIEVEGAPKK